jgi:hypothetical protein
VIFFNKLTDAQDDISELQNCRTSAVRRLGQISCLELSVRVEAPHVELSVCNQNFTTEHEWVGRPKAHLIRNEVPEDS